MVIRRHWTLVLSRVVGAASRREVLIILPHTQKLHATSGVEFFILKPWKALQPCEHEMKPQAYETSFLRLA